MLTAARKIGLFNHSYFKLFGFLKSKDMDYYLLTCKNGIFSSKSFTKLALGRVPSGVVRSYWVLIEAYHSGSVPAVV